jgi:ribosome-binding protein aMBF1 (putative translation factor)
VITNERQYKITKSQIIKFRNALENMTSSTTEHADVHPRLIRAEREAMESQLSDLETEVADYESLKSERPAVINVDSFEDLGDGIIKARIASGLSQKALAERLGLKEQQIQRYEAERYSSASFSRIRDVVSSLGVRIRNDILLPAAPGNFEGLISKLKQVGIQRDFVVKHLLTSADAAIADGEVANDDESQLTARTTSVLGHVFGWTKDNIIGSAPLAPPRRAAAEARFKMPKGRNRDANAIYATYANHLAVVAIKGSTELPINPISANAGEIRSEILRKYQAIDLPSTLQFVWDLGVVVLPLHGQGSFHGACWRYDRRNVIVLKQTSRHVGRWLFDLLHELFHAAQDPSNEALEVIESDEMSEERRNSDEEIAASQFAGDICLNGEAEQIAQACVAAAKNSVERLKRVVPIVAADFGVGPDLLANYMAYRLSWQGINWWGTAANLQAASVDPWAVTRDTFIARFPFKFENAIDRQLIERALH